MQRLQSKFIAPPEAEVEEIMFDIQCLMDEGIERYKEHRKDPRVRTKVQRLYLLWSKYKEQKDEFSNFTKEVTDARKAHNDKRMLWAIQALQDTAKADDDEFGINWIKFYERSDGTKAKVLQVIVQRWDSRGAEKRYRYGKYLTVWQDRFPRAFGWCIENLDNLDKE